MNGFETKELSVVVPAYNEEKCLRLFFDRTIAALDELKTNYELIIVNDGSIDATESIIREYANKCPGKIKGIMLKENVGQHIAIVAGFSRCVGEYVMTMDADLQNPPEEIKKVFDAIKEGYDAIGTYRVNRDDAFLRKLSSKIVNIVISIYNQGFTIRDYGCMMRIFSKEVIDGICGTYGKPDFVPVMALTFADKYREIPIAHEARVAGDSKYSVTSLTKLMQNLIMACKRLKHPTTNDEPPCTDYFKIREIVT